MVKPLAIAAALSLLAACAAGAGAGPGLPASIDYDAETRAIARDFIDILYVQTDAAGAYAKYATPNFIDHNPEIADAANGVGAFRNARQALDPPRDRDASGWRNEVTHVLVQHKMFAMLQAVFTGPDDPGRICFDIFRVENGRVVEHWSVAQANSPSPLNDNTMHRSLSPHRRQSRNAPAPEAVIRDYIRMSAEEGAVAAMERYLAPDVIQHTPNIPDGKAAAIAFFRDRDNGRRTPEEIAQRITGIVRIISDGDLVLAHRHVRRPSGLDEVSVDLWRVHDGLIVEHWGAIQNAPATAAGGRTMW
ncbi:MAG: nuclear transport factor 2 family protein [Hyphomonadaceae bacterium]|nr:nuclear transport factor 2 family protein [Hyphomonadaceae bacterium]